MPTNTELQQAFSLVVFYMWFGIAGAAAAGGEGCGIPAVPGGTMPGIIGIIGILLPLVTGGEQPMPG